MMVSEQVQDRSALRWIRGELDQTLREARTSLEDFVDGQPDRLQVCIDSLHHVHGALEMVQVYGGSMLADEMEQLAQMLLQGRVRRADAAAEALMLGMVQLPAYLERVETGGADIPLALLPLMNDLRAAHDAPLVSETSLFAPKLDAVIAAETVRPGSGNRELPHIVLHYRSQFHRALLNWIRGQEVKAALGQIRDLLDALNAAAGTTRLRRLLDAGEALATALLDGDEAPALAVRPLFGKLDRVFKTIIDQGEEAAMLDFPVDLLKNLLYYIARSKSQDPAVVALQRSADLANSFPDPLQSTSPTGSLGGPDREMFQAVSEALGQDLRDVKDQLDLFMRSDRGQLARLTNLADPIQRIGDTLGMVGRGDLRTRLKRHCEELRAAEESGTSPGDDRLMTLAGDLLSVESSLSSLGAVGEEMTESADGDEGAVVQMLSKGEMHQHLRAAVDEAQVELTKSKEAILEFLDDPKQVALIESVPTRLHGVEGVLRMLGLPDAADVLGALRPYLTSLGDGTGSIPDAEERDAIADAIVGTELYMRSAVEPGADRDKLLGVADSALRRLGLRSGGEPAQVVHLGVVADAAQQAPASEDARDGDELAVVAAMDELPEFEPVTSADPVEEVPAPFAESAEPVDAAEDRSGEVADSPVPSYTVDESQPDGDSTEQADPASQMVDEIDSEILEIFAEEAEEELGSIQACYPRWREDRSDSDALTTMRRSFHTLKGSGRIVGALNIGEFSWSIENLLNRVIDGTVGPSDELFGLMDEVVAVLPRLVEESDRPHAAGTDVSGLSERAFALAGGSSAGGSPTGLSGAAEPSTDAIEDDLSTTAVQDADPALADIAGDVETSAPEGLPFGTIQAADEAVGDVAVELIVPDVADESILTDIEVEDSDFSEIDNGSLDAPDTSLYAVFLNEARDHIKVLADFIGRCRESADGCEFDAGVHRAMHTLHGSASTAGVTSMAELAGSLEGLSNVMRDAQRHTDHEVLDLLDRGHGKLNELAARIEEHDEDVGDCETLCADIRHKAEVLATEMVRDVAPVVEEVVYEAAESAPVEAVASSQDGLESLDQDLLEVFLEEAKELLEALEGEFADWQSEPDGRGAAVTGLQRTLHTMKGGARLAGVMSVGDLSHAMESAFESVAERRVDGTARMKQLVRHATDALAHDIELLLRGRMPPVHEAMIERLEAAAHGREWEDVSATELAIEPERLGAFSTSAPEADPMGAGQAGTAYDGGADAGTAPLAPTGFDAEPADADPGFAATAAGTGFTADDTDAMSGSASKVVHFPAGGQQVDEEGFVPRRPAPDEEPTPQVATERVRVASEVLDQMVNNAGEVSIYRARMEQMNTSFAFNLGELEQTIDRLRAQLRDLEIETEAQILSRHEREHDARADFDPLELDRYSTMQQLSRALSETVEDLSNLGQSLNDLSRDTDTLLLQQSRLTTDLQDSLLRTRMVKFSSRVPRLERVVRQTGHGLGKQAGLEVAGGAEDMDRAILERMMSPLEHLLRNAVSHGIEDGETRLAAGKPVEGRITLRLAREGTDIVLRLSDDGAGLDRERIRAKAIERGLLDTDAEVSDDELYQLILQPGFSTAQELSQVSGRGVGMDVVLTEVKQLGGSLEIESTPGAGTGFIIRLPFTLAITDSLLVTLGDDIFAVPHSSMDGVVRISTDELRAIYAGDQPTFRYDDRDYDVRYLGTMLNSQPLHLGEGTRWLPLLLVHSGEHRVAIQVDGVIGNRQIVVKSVGAQLSTVRWFTGGTILADGQIALILDVNALVRTDSRQQPTTLVEHAAPVTKGVSVMVVDDSITVRKVTSRLLERHNMYVMTAKDGVDAVTQLQEQRPDVVLLDIEMPRMDGFELARHMRSTPELSDIPIIMITSRTGDKHRSRAIELGVKRYLGKPYQEADLLENIYTVLADSAL